MNETEQLKKIFEQEGVLAVTDEKCRGFSRYAFSQLLKSGFLTRAARGVYAHAGERTRETMSYEEVAKIRPEAVLCLFSALRVHGLTDENPSRIHVAIPQGKRFPRGVASVQVYHLSPASWSFGIEEHQGGYGPFKVYSVEKTLADCFKFRSVVGLDVAIAALKEASNKGKINWNKLWRAMEVCRMTKVMRPYVESLG